MAAVVAMGLFAPASADAAVTATLTGDDGQPAPLTAGTPPTIRNMNASAGVTLAQGDAASWRWVVTDGAGTPITSNSCWNSLRTDSGRVPYRGNGTYTLTVSLYSNTNCGTLKSTAQYSWTVAAGVAISPPAGALPLRPANTSVTNTHTLGFSGNPGASLYEVRYAKGGVIGPDGGISGPSATAYVDSTTGLIRVSSWDGPGQYVMVARAKSGDYYTPWSAPVPLSLVAPFDLQLVTFPDSRGPSYQLRATVREKALAGSRITVSVAKGSKGKKFKRLGRAKVNSQGVFKLRFRLSRGTYRLRYAYKGSSAVAGGNVYQVIKIRRILG